MKKKAKINLNYNCIRNLVSDTVGVITTGVTYGPIRDSIDGMGYSLTLNKLRRKYRDEEVDVEDITMDEVRDAI